MAVELLMPRISDEFDEGVLSYWLVETGWFVQAGTLVAEVQVEKTTAEVRAPVSGTIVSLLAEKGGVVRQGEVIAVLEESSAGESLRSEAPSPVAVDSIPNAEATYGPSEPASAIRRVIATRLREELDAIVPVTLTRSADITDLRIWLDGLGGANAFSYTAIAIAASGRALRDHPRLAARWDAGSIAYAREINIGFAVALDDGLLVPVIRDADRKRVTEISDEVSELARHARAGTLTQAQQEHGVFSITNLGAFGVGAFTPVINPPQTSILGLGQASWSASVIDGAVQPRFTITLSLTIDHRLVDGAPGAKFLEDLAGHMNTLRD